MVALIDAVFCWTPADAAMPTAGKVFVTTVPMPAGDYGYMKTSGRVFGRWPTHTHAERFQILQTLFAQMIHRDGLEENVAREALADVDDLDVKFLSNNPAHLDGQHDD